MPFVIPVQKPQIRRLDLMSHSPGGVPFRRPTIQRMPAPRSFVLSTLSLLLFAIPLLAEKPAHSLTIIGVHSGNGVSSAASAAAGFSSASGDDFASHDPLPVVSDIDFAPGTTVTASIANAPGAGTGTAEGSATLNFTYGTAITDDTFEFLFDATASALTAQNIPPVAPGPEDADAAVFLVLSAIFRLDSGIWGRESRRIPRISTPGCTQVHAPLRDVFCQHPGG